MKNTYKVGMISLGCPKNQVDGELLLEKLSENGFQIVQRIEDSDLMIVNTCGFIEDAKREAIETILEVAQYKAAGVISAIVVTGCLAERYQDQVMERFRRWTPSLASVPMQTLLRCAKRRCVAFRLTFSLAKSCCPWRARECFPRPLTGHI